MCLDYKLLTYQGLTVGKIINIAYIYVLQKKRISLFTDMISQFVIVVPTDVPFPCPYTSCSHTFNY